MHITLPPAPRLATNQPQPPTTPDRSEEPAEPADQFQAAPSRAEAVAFGAQRWERDALLGTAGLSTVALPGAAGTSIGLGFGALATLTGIGEIHEGIKSGNTRLAVDGTLHVLAGGLLAAGGVYSHTSYTPYLAAGLGALLLVKTGYNHPGGALKAAARESASLVSDAAGAAVHGIKDGWKAATQEKG